MIITTISIPPAFLYHTIWKFDQTTITFAPSSYTRLIQKGGGTWPCDALATILFTKQEKVLIPAPVAISEKDKLAEITLHVQNT